MAISNYYECLGKHLGIYDAWCLEESTIHTNN